MCGHNGQGYWRSPDGSDGEAVVRHPRAAILDQVSNPRSAPQNTTASTTRSAPAVADVRSAAAAGGDIFNGDTSNGDTSDGGTSDGDASRKGARTAPRSQDRRKAAPLARIGMIVFAVGLIAIFADMILFAAGSRNLPLWLNLTAMLAPVGLGLGLLGVVRENRSASPALAARRAARDRS